VYGAEMTERTAELNRAYQANEARTGRAFSASQDALKMAQAERLNALSISSAAGNAAASRELQKELAKMPDANQRFYASLSPTGNVREGYAYAMEQRGESSTNRDILVRAEKFLENPLNQRANPELWRQAQEVVGRSFAIQPPSMVSSPAGTVRQP
jgi:hypothetical protein